MIIVYHQHNKVSSIWNKNIEKNISISTHSIAKCLFQLAVNFPDTQLIWCHISQKNNLGINTFQSLSQHPESMYSYNPNAENYLPEAIGYVEESPFLNVKKINRYPTWQMSSAVGGINSRLLKALKISDFETENFDYFLNSVAKRLMPFGLLCYSEPNLLLFKNEIPRLKTATKREFCKFVKQHYKTQWSFLLQLNLLIYERKLYPLSFINSLFYASVSFKNPLKTDFNIKNEMVSTSIDVIIPTIGREKYLFYFLKDLSVQNHLPSKVVIVEQNPQPESISGLNFLTDENWPFEIKSIFTHQAGACNARNLALKETTSDWVFFADDDIRIESDFLQKAIVETAKYDASAFTFHCFQQGEKEIFQRVFQWPTFGSGCSFVKKEALNDAKFDLRFEFGFGEDADFGMQLRNNGFDILYLPTPKILHLKAPIGGFRTKPKLDWQDDIAQPKPSPTVMLYKLMHLTPTQLWGYKTILFFKYYKLQSIKNPFRYYNNFQKQWKQSLFWAKTIMMKK